MSQPPKPSRKPPFTPLVLAVAAVALLLPAAPAVAQRGGDPELTLFAGYRLDGEVDGDFDFVDFGREIEIDAGPVLGAAFGIPLAPNMQIELRLDRQDTELVFDEGLFGGRRRVADIALTTAHVGFLYQWTPGEARPYVVGSAGFTHLDPDLPGGDTETRLSGAIGGGVKLFFGGDAGLRLDGRLLLVDVDASFGHDDDRFGRDDEDVLVQPEATVGVLFRF